MKKQFAAIVAAALGLPACNAGAGEAPAGPVASAGEVASVRDGRTTLAVGHTLLVARPSNATTGYRWHISDSYSDLLLPGSPFGDEVIDAHVTGIVGVGGTTVWRFRAVRAGTATLTLTYGRLWQRTRPRPKPRPIRSRFARVGRRSRPRGTGFGFSVRTSGT